MRHLPQRMNTRVGSTSSLHFKVGVNHSSDGFAQLTHDGARILLFLPAAVSRAVVFQEKFKVGQEISCWTC